MWHSPFLAISKKEEVRNLSVFLFENWCFPLGPSHKALSICATHYDKDANITDFDIFSFIGKDVLQGQFFSFKF